MHICVLAQLQLQILCLTAERCVDNWENDDCMRECVKVTLPDGAQVSLVEWLAQRGRELGAEKLIGRQVWIFWFDEINPRTGKGTWFKAVIEGGCCAVKSDLCQGVFWQSGSVFF